MFGFSKKNIEVVEQNVLFHEDHSAGEVNESIAGRKGLSLFKLRDMDVPVPDFFVISPKVYKDFILSSFDNKIAKQLDKGKEPDVKDIEKMILSSDFADEVREDILRCYSRLSGFSNAWVAVRSSVVYPQDPSVSFSGLFHTELSVKGVDQLLEAIKYVYLSLFKDKAVLYSREKGVDLAGVQMAIVVQRMVQPEVSGIVYTIDPITNDNKKMSIEAVFGLGDVIADGSITPDQYVLEKKELNIIEKKISPQEWMRIRKTGDVKVGSLDSFQRVQISSAWSHQQKIEDRYLEDIAKVSLIIESKSKQPQLVEWAWESGNVWVLQNKEMFPETEKAVSKVSDENDVKSVYDIAIEMVKDEKEKELSQKEDKVEVETAATKEAVKADDKSVEEKVPTTQESVEGQEVEDSKVKIDDKELAQLEKKVDKAEAKKEKKVVSEKIKMVKAQQSKKVEMGVPIDTTNERTEFLLSGIGASVGIADGELILVDSKTDPNTVVTKGSILLMKDFLPGFEKMVMNSGGIIMDGGGLTSDVAILSREVGVPAVVGTGLASSLLSQGEIVRIDGNVGSVYRFVPLSEKEEKVEKDVKKDESTPEVEALTEDRIEAIKEAQADPQKLYSTATKVFIMPEKGSRANDYAKFIPNSNGISYIDLEGVMAEFGRHPLAYVEDKTYKGFAKQIEVILDDFSDLAEGNEVIVSIGSQTAGEMRELVKGKSLEGKDIPDEMHGAQRLLLSKDLLEKEVSLIKTVRNVYKSRNISLAVHSPLNGSIMKEIKKEIAAVGLKRTGTFKIYAVIETPAEVILAEEIIKSGIDGVIVNTVSLAMQMQGLSRRMENPKYDISTNSLWNVIDDLVKKVKGKDVEVIIQIEDSVKLLKNCIKAGVYGISVSPGYTDRFKMHVSEEEARMILSIDD